MGTGKGVSREQRRAHACSVAGRKYFRTQEPICGEGYVVAASAYPFF